MKKKVLFIIIGILLLSITGCAKKEELKKEIDEEKLISCITKELETYIISEKSTLEEIPLNEYTNNTDKINFFESHKTNNNNIYVIVKSNTNEIINEFNIYFSKKFQEYQTYTIHDYHIFIHNNNIDIDFNSLNKCQQTISSDSKTISFNEDISKKLNNTNKVVVTSGNYKLGTLQNEDIINELLATIKESKIYGEVFLMDATTIKLEMYNDKDLIETINLYNDGVRIKITNQSSYYTTTKDIRAILEKELDYRFFTLYHLSDECDNTSQLIYEDNDYQYYFNCSSYGIIQVNLLTTNKLIDLKYALDNNYINVDELLIYESLIIKVKKTPQNEELVKIKDYIPNIVVDLKYATKDNFTNQIIYENNEAYLRYGTIKKLIDIQNALNKKGYTLVIWDAYRSVENQFKLWNTYPDANYVSNPNTGYSSHSKGNTIDITIQKLNGDIIEMPSEFDNFTKLADRDYSDISNIAKENALLLENIMYNNGFKGYQKEWWHYTDTTDYEVIK